MGVAGVNALRWEWGWDDMWDDMQSLPCEETGVGRYPIAALEGEGGVG